MLCSEALGKHMTDFLSLFIKMGGWRREYNRANEYLKNKSKSIRLYMMESQIFTRFLELVHDP